MFLYSVRDNHGVLGTPNALDKIDETIKARDNAQNSKNTEQDTTIANNNPTAISLTIVNKNALKVELTKGNGSKISGQTDLPVSGRVTEIDFPDDIPIGEQWYTKSGFRDRFITYTSGGTTVDRTVELKRISKSSGQLEDMVLFDPLTNQMYKVKNPTKIEYSGVMSFHMISEISQWRTSGTYDMNIETTLRPYLEGLFLNKYTNLSEVFIADSSSLTESYLIRVPLTVDSNRKITALGTISAVSKTTNITTRTFYGEDAYRIYMDTGANTSDGKMGYIASKPWNQDFDPFDDNFIRLSPSKMLYDGPITDLVKAKSASDTSKKDGYIHIPREFDIEYISYYSTYRVTVHAFPYTPADWATHYTLGAWYENENNIWKIDVSIGSDGASNIAKVKYNNDNVSQITGKLNNGMSAITGYRLYV